MITMPLFFASNALYPVAVMPAWLKVISHVNPLTYEVDALRGLLIGTSSHLLLDFGAGGRGRRRNRDRVLACGSPRALVR